MCAHRRQVDQTAFREMVSSIFEGKVNSHLTDHFSHSLFERGLGDFPDSRNRRKRRAAGGNGFVSLHEARLTPVWRRAMAGKRNQPDYFT